MISLGLNASALAPSGKADTVYSGVVTDAMCGAQHTMGGGSPADCVHMCVSGGSDYALVVGQKVYTLATKSKRELAILFKYAGKRVSVRGALKGDTLSVHSISPARA
ncbi:MAG: hypothetical protein ACRD1Y_00240 [Terriglobales bacterium]